MALTAGIVGLPNVGKSTLFNAITKSTVEAANYPFATIDPNVGVVEVPDERLAEITKRVHPKKEIPTTFEFTDIAGLVEGASKGEGLGNRFLSHIREVDAICHVVRAFDDEEVTHVEESVDPIRDIEIINLELIFADLQTVENRMYRLKSKVKSKDKEAVFEYNLLDKLKTTLEANNLVRSLDLSKDEEAICKNFHLLTSKPVLYIANMSEEGVFNPEENEYFNLIKAHAAKEDSDVIPICAKTEEDLSELSDEEKEIFFEDLNISESGLDRVIRATYELLDLQTYFTAGVQEVRAWTFKKGMKAPQTAGIIHSDFERGFIRAETYSYDDLIKYGSEAEVKAAGRLRSEGKEYVVQDGDIILFRFNV
ncbi:MAG TPA: redox-regulated ATPase YchF [Erysipelotrichaceae bacterium]|nr:redox-regulated ATPase YchF [Erysipelotrichaceae bacterium]